MDMLKISSCNVGERVYSLYRSGRPVCHFVAWEKPGDVERYVTAVVLGQIPQIFRDGSDLGRRVIDARNDKRCDLNMTVFYGMLNKVQDHYFIAF